MYRVYGFQSSRGESAVGSSQQLRASTLLRASNQQYKQLSGPADTGAEPSHVQCLPSSAALPWMRTFEQHQTFVVFRGLGVESPETLEGKTANSQLPADHDAVRLPIDCCCANSLVLTQKQAQQQQCLYLTNKVRRHGVDEPSKRKSRSINASIQ